MNHLLKSTFFIGLFASFLFVSAQDQLLTIEDASYMNRSLFPERVAQLQWLGDSDYYIYAKENSLYKVSAKRGTETLLLDLDMINSGMQFHGYDSIKRMPSCDFYNEDFCYLKSGNSYFTYDIVSNQLSKHNQIPDTAKNIDLQKETGIASFTIDNNMYISIEGEIEQITKDSDPGIVNGQGVHRREFGISGGTFWSNDGTKLAFYRKDETMVTDYPLVDITKRIAEVETTKYPMAGMTSEEVTLGIYDLAKGTTVFMKTGDPKDQYLTSVTWGPNSNHIYIALLNRDQNHLKLNKYNASTGDFIETLFEEMHPKYVEPETPMYFHPLRPAEFVWLSERDGYNHIYLHSSDGALIKQLTQGNWVVTEFLGFYGKDFCYFRGTKDSPIEQNIYSVSMSDGTITRISPDLGTHRAKINKNGKYIIDSYSSTDVTSEYKLLNNKGKELRVIQEDKNTLEDYKLGEMTISTLKADDGTDLFYRLIKPVDFNSSQKYPAIVYVYGGPHAQLVTDSWLGGAGLFLNYLAQQGFVVFTIDNRGSANRGRDFEQAIFRNLGEQEMKDQMVGVEYLKSLPYVDTDRIGINGWSYGGFMTTSLMVREPGVFKVGVCGGPVIDWKYYEVMYGERYMDTPEDNPEGYKNSNLLNYVDNLQGKLLIIHGTSDPTVVWQHSLVFIQEAIKQGKLVDYFVYPGHGHGVRGSDRIHLNKKMAAYFKDNL